MRNLLTLVLVTAIAAICSSETLRADGNIRLAQATITTPIPQPVPSLDQNFTTCSMSCNTQVGSCQAGCAGLTDPAQCFLSCTSQQLVCQQNCPH
jgi:hypothetical protein